MHREIPQVERRLIGLYSQMSCRDAGVPITAALTCGISLCRMWHLTATLLVLGLASASPQGGYLPPRPSCPTVTSVVYDTRVQTSVAVQTQNRVDTQYVTTTLVRQQVVPTTIYNTRVTTRVQYQTSVIQQTSVRAIDRVVTQTVPSPQDKRSDMSHPPRSSHRSAMSHRLRSRLRSYLLRSPGHRYKQLTDQ
ncbi:hypothetical protein Pcinc_035683 [Petrolisthes cinctipes]|uniref:Uncharacterized protein n=1 Tax=Petrolisthes cinctipes TaxID=88211 RepID=A0AAE1C0D0_PETCI|nr:hypothetical protein Pcinc_035683 [Petrolisthes cinctipes]